MPDKPKRQRPAAVFWYVVPFKKGNTRRVHKSRDCITLAHSKEVQAIHPSDARRIPRCWRCFPDEIEATLKSRSTQRKTANDGERSV